MSMYYVWNSYKVKSLDVLLKALNIVVNEKNKKNVKLKIVGTGEYKDFYESICHSLKLNDNVEFMGYVNNDEIPNILCNSDVLCVSSSFETFCIPIVEAFASGIPVITTNCTGPLEYIDSKCGEFFDAHDIEGMCDAIERVSKKLDKYDVNYLRSVSLKYSRENVANIAINVYKKMLDKNKKAH